MNSPDAPPVPWRGVAALVALAWGLQVCALWAHAYPPLIDLPNHLARHALEARWLAGRDLPPFYEIEYRLLPNLGGDLVVPPLLLVLDAPAAARVFLTAAVFLYWLGPLAFLRACGPTRPQTWLAAALLLPWGMNSYFFWGFANYYSGVGLAFLVLAHYLRLRVRPSLSVWPWALHALLVALLWFWHLGAWGLYGLALGGHLLATGWTRYRRERQWRSCVADGLPACLAAVPSLVIFVVYSRQNAGVNPGAGFAYGTLLQKVAGFLGPFRAYQTVPDVLAGLLWVAAVVVAFRVGALRAHWRHWLTLVVVVVVGLYWVVPGELGSTGAAAARLMPLALVAAVGLAAQLPLRRPGLALLLLAACLAVRYGSVLVTWERFAGELNAQAEAFPLLDRGSRVLPVILAPAASSAYPGQHFPSWAVPERDLFLPTQFAYRDQQPLVIREPYRSYPRGYRELAEGGAVEVDADEVRGRYDYVWVYNPGGREVRVPAAFERVYEGGMVTVWRVR